jgi:uncharacterized protein (TIGR02300 family)
MPAKDLGTKHLCFKCGARFYDLKKPEPLCPKCGTDQRQNPALKAPGEKRRAAPRPAPAPVAAEEEAETPDLEADADDLDEDDEDEDEADAE